MNARNKYRKLYFSHKAMVVIPSLFLKLFNKIIYLFIHLFKICATGSL